MFRFDPIARFGLGRRPVISRGFISAEFNSIVTIIRRGPTVQLLGQSHGHIRDQRLHILGRDTRRISPTNERMSRANLKQGRTRGDLANRTRSLTDSSSMSQTELPRNCECVHRSAFCNHNLLITVTPNPARSAILDRASLSPIPSPPAHLEIELCDDLLEIGDLLHGLRVLQSLHDALLTQLTRRLDRSLLLGTQQPVHVFLLLQAGMSTSARDART
jgi:hypothetical protein